MKRKPKTISLTNLGRKIGRNPSSISRQLVAAGVIPISRGKYPAEAAAKVMQEAVTRDNNAQMMDSGTPAYKYKMLQCKRLLQEIQRYEEKSIDHYEHVSKMVTLASIMRDVLMQMVSQTRTETCDATLVKHQERAMSEAFKRANAMLRQNGINEIQPT